MATAAGIIQMTKSENTTTMEWQAKRVSWGKVAAEESPDDFLLSN
jgi:hypothetical protein